jgi:hypothetical protein
MEYFYKLMKQKQQIGKIDEFVKRLFILEILDLRFGEKLNPDDDMISEIKNQIGDNWEQIPMPVASVDLPEMVEEAYLLMRH